jgi:hypothetical protein
MPSGEDVSSTLTQRISRYMVLSLFYRLNSVSNPAGADYGLSYDILKDSEMIIAQVLRAFNNPSKLKFPALRGNSDVVIVVLPWGIEDYARRLTPCQNIGTPSNENRLSKDFPPLFTVENGQLLPLEEPCTVVDSRGIIILWYIPSSLSTKRNVSSVNWYYIY